MERMTALAKAMRIERQERLNDDAEPSGMGTRPVARSQDEARARLVTEIFSELSRAPSWNTASRTLRWHVAEEAVARVFGDPTEMNRARDALEELITISALVDAESGAEPRARTFGENDSDPDELDPADENLLASLGFSSPEPADQKRPMTTSTAYSGSVSSASASGSTMSMSDFKAGIYAFGSGPPSTETLRDLRTTAQERTLEAVEAVENLLDTAAMSSDDRARDMRLLGTLSTMDESVFELTFVSKPTVDALEECHRRFDQAAIELGRQGSPKHIDMSKRIGQALQVLRKNSERYENFRQSDVASNAAFDGYPIWALVLYAEGLKELESTLPVETLKMETMSEAEPSDDEGESQDPLRVDQPLEPTASRSGSSEGDGQLAPGGELQSGSRKRHRKKPPRGALVGTSTLNVKGDSKAGTGKIKRSGISHHHMGSDKSLKKALRDLAGRRGKKWNHRMAVRTFKKG